MNMLVFIDNFRISGAPKVIFLNIVQPRILALASVDMGGLA
jgi:hypothetical protein